jgi:hypothetical protein
LNDLKLDWVSFLQGAITITGDGGIMYENVWTIIAPDEAISLGIVKPLHGSMHFDCPPDRVFEIPLHGARGITLTLLKIRIARSVFRIGFRVNRTIVFPARKKQGYPCIKTIQTVHIVKRGYSERKRR